MFRFVPYDTQAGVPIRAQVDVSAWSFTSSLTSPGQGSFTLPLRALGMSREMNRRLLSGWETTWAVESNPAPAFSRVWTVEYAGVVVDREWSADGGTATVKTLEIAKFLELRPLWGTLGQDSSMRAVFELSGQTLGDIIREVLWWAVASPRNDTTWPLPVDVGALRSGPLMRAEWRYHMRPAAEIIDEIAGEDGAPDWALTPVKDGDRLKWVLELGDPYLAAPVLRLPVAAPGVKVKSQVVELKARVDSQSERTGIVAVGSGSEVDMRVGDAGRGQVSTVRGNIPALIGSQSHKNIDDVAQLDSLARGELAAAAGGTEQWSFSVQTGWDERVKPGMIRKGSTLLLDHPGDEVIEPGRVKHYVLSVQVDHTMKYRVESQEMAR